MWGLHNLNLCTVKEVIHEFPFLEEVDLSWMNDVQVKDIGIALKEVESQNLKSSLTTIVLKFCEFSDDNKLFENN